MRRWRPNVKSGSSRRMRARSGVGRPPSCGSATRGACRLIAAALVAGCATASQAAEQDRPSRALGVVFDDGNGNGRRDPGEKGLPGVAVSNGRQVVQTDAQGRWTLPIDDDTILFVVKPSGWMTQLDELGIPRFYYIHKPAGSPKSKHPGVAPTGPLPNTIDFPLTRQPEPDRFSVVLFADTQPRNQREIDYVAHDVVEELVGVEAAFGMTLGDIMFDDLSLFESLNRTIALTGIPWYNVIGNHDSNAGTSEDRYSDETFERVYGPPYYSFNYGRVHFLVLDDVNWLGDDKSKRRHSYVGGLGPRQLEFIRNDLALVPPERLVVLTMHIPLYLVEDRQELFRLMENRAHVFSVSGHMHFQKHWFAGREDGWKGDRPHHHLVNGTVSGSWWRGAPDELGIPHTMMRDGTPNGYSIATFEGSNVLVRYKVARRPGDYQMNVYAPEVVAASTASDAEVLVNVFAGSEHSRVEMRFGRTGPWKPMERVEREDPALVRLKELEKGSAAPLGKTLPRPIPCSHLWRATLPADPAPGTYLIRVRETDVFGQVHGAVRVIRIE